MIRQCVLLLFVLTPLAQAEDPNVINIGDRLELFVDSFLIEQMKGASLRLHVPREEEVVWAYQHPLESRFFAKCSGCQRC